MSQNQMTTAQPAPAAPVSDERAAFEAWASSCWHDTSMYQGLYKSVQTHALWCAWETRAILSLRPAPAQPMSEDTARLDWVATNEAHIGWNREGEVCRVWAVQDEEKGAEPLTGWHNSARAAIDAARGITAQAGESS